MKRWIVLLLLFVSANAGIYAQSANAPTISLESPYNTMYVHLHYLQPESYRPDLASVTLSRSADSLKNIQNAIKLKQIFDGNGLYVRLNQLPQEANYVDSISRKPYYTPFPRDLPDVYLEKIDDKWYYSAETIRQIPRLHRKTYPFGTDRLLNLLPRLGQQRFMGLALWQYLGIVILLFVIWLFHKILTGILLPIIRRFIQSRFHSDRVDKKKILKVARALSLFLVSLLARILVPVLQLPIASAEFTIISINIISTVILVVLAVRILRVIMDYALHYAQGTEHKMDEQLIPILNRILMILFVLAGLIHILRLLDVNVTALIAGVSIGGLALALAAQDTVKNLIGSAMIFFDRPFQIGDYLVGNGFEGTVMEVGFRTTRIRTLDTSIVSVPNGTIANMVVKNMGMRVFRVFSTTIGVTYDTPPQLIEEFIRGLKIIINNHPLARQEDYYVHLQSMEASSLNILFRVYLEVGTYAEELKAKEALLLGILRLAEAIGVRFAFPSSSIYVESLPEQKSAAPVYPVNKDQIQNALDQFAADFRARNRLDDPDFRA